MNNGPVKLLTLAVLGLLIVSCGKGPQQGGSSVSEADQEKSVSADEIQWFEGTVEEAFAAAKAEGKPIYLYWGAEWCPPCHAIKATVFRSAEFIRRSKLFVPVYLDGDKELVGLGHTRPGQVGAGPEARVVAFQHREHLVRRQVDLRRSGPLFQVRSGAPG